MGHLRSSLSALATRTSLRQIKQGPLARQHFLPLWKKVARTKSATDEGFLSAEAVPAETYPSPVTTALPRVRATLSHKGEGKRCVSVRPKPLRCPRIEAAGYRRLAAAALWRDVQPDDRGVGEQAGIVGRLEKPFRLGMDGVERPFRQCVLQFAGAAGQRGECGRAKDRHAKVGK